MLKRISPLEKMLAVSIIFNMALLLLRFYRLRELEYGFYVWNTFLAILPLLFSRQLIRIDRINTKAILLLACWLQFFPNAPYMITDLFHFTIKPPIPQWFDLLIVTSAAWNGLLLGIISLMQVEQFLSRHLKDIWVKSIVVICFILCGYGVYIGRYLRFNTWDTVARPKVIFPTLAAHIFFPFDHVKIWAFSVLFGGMFGIVYYTLKQLKKSAPLSEGRLV